MTGYRRYALASVCAVLSIVMAVGSARGQLRTTDAPKKKVVDTVHILTTLVNSQTNTFSIPDDRTSSSRTWSRPVEPSTRAP